MPGPVKIPQVGVPCPMVDASGVRCSKWLYVGPDGLPSGHTGLCVFLELPAVQPR